MKPPVLKGRAVTLRPAMIADVAALGKLLNQPEITEWWGETDVTGLATDIGDDDVEHMVIEVDGEVAGMVQFSEEDDPMYRSAGIDIAIATGFQGQGHGTDAVRTVARYLLEEKGHHRLTIDPAASNVRAIATYARVGFKLVGVMRQYEQGADGTFHDGLLMDLLREDFVP